MSRGRLDPAPLHRGAAAAPSKPALCGWFPELALEPVMKTYKVPLSTIIFTYGLLGLVSLIAVIGVFLGVGAEEGLLPQPFLILWLVLLAGVWYFYGRIPVAITWRDDGVLEFKSLMGTIRVPVQEIIAVKSSLMYWGFIKINYNGGSLRLICQMTGLYELLGTVKAHNPQVEITGC
jgi:hypothetical protein